MTNIWGFNSFSKIQAELKVFQEFPKDGTATFVILKLHKMTTDFIWLVGIFPKGHQTERIPGNLPKLE